jgi:hypothetical protein
MGKGGSAAGRVDEAKGDPFPLGGADAAPAKALKATRAQKAKRGGAGKGALATGTREALAGLAAQRERELEREQGTTFTL